ncbi:bifunctional metallophosphatase/5'-nucleotidase [Candidatus Ozemobacteraceae bacterium]|nr:bifunctional metallophosphatase/5'-nucleotidase [Candidatus Ozemobacteraceae bacterium]
MKTAFARKTSHIYFLLFILAVFGLSPDVSAKEKTVTILYTNDHHSHLLPADMPEFGKQVGGIARRHELIRSIRASETCVLLLDGGDIFQGTPFYSYFKGKTDLEAFSLCGYDATTLGNHEFDDGLANLLDQYRYASFPLLCANVVNASSGAPIFPPYRIIERDGLSIGVAGVIGNAAWDVISVTNRAGMRLIEPVSAVASLVAEIGPRTDLFVLLSHSGYEHDVALASQVAGIDVIVGGHTNTYLETPTVVRSEPTVVPSSTGSGTGTIVVQAFKWGVFLGRLDLRLAGDGTITNAEGRLIPVTASVAVPLDSPVHRLVESYDEMIRARTSQVVGRSDGEFLYPEKRKHLDTLPLGSLVAQSLVEFTGADMAIINSGCIREILPRGPITLGQVYSMLPFDNTIVTLTMDGRSLVAMFDYLCEHYGTISGFQYSGVTCTFDVGNRTVADLRIAGRPVESGKTYRVATISYLSDGNQHGNILFKEATARKDDGYFYREAFLDYIRRHPIVTMPAVPSPIRLINADSFVPTYD